MQQINIRVPEGTAADGAAAIRLRVDDAFTQDGVTLAVARDP